MRAIRSDVGGRSLIKERVKPEQKKPPTKKADATFKCVSIEDGRFLRTSEREKSPSPTLRAMLSTKINFD